MVDNYLADSAIGGLKAIDLYFLPPNTTSITHSMNLGIIWSLMAKCRSRMIQQIVKASYAHKPISKVSILDAMKVLAISWEDVTGETVQKCSKLAKQAKDKTQAQNGLDDPFIELRSNIERLRRLGSDEILQNLTPEDFANFDDTIAATKPALNDNLIISVVRNSEIEEEEEIDEEDGDDTIGASGKCFEKPTPIAIMSIIETIMSVSVFAKSEEMQRCTIKFQEWSKMSRQEIWSKLL